MADDITLPATGTGTETPVVATDDVGGKHYQRIKIDLGGDGLASPLLRGQGTKSTSIAVTLASDEDILALLDGVEAALSTIIGHVDGIEGLVDGIEALIGTTNTNTGNAATSLGILDDWDNAASTGVKVSGDIPHDTADGGEPVKTGGKAIDLGTTPTAVDANDRVNAIFTRAGIPFVLGGHPNIISKNLNITDADGAQTDAALITVAAGTAIVVTKVSVMVDSAVTATGGVAVRIGFGTANVPAVDSAGIIMAHPGIAAGSGVVEGNGAGIIGIGASNEDLRITCEDPVGGNIDVIITYFTILIG